MGYMGSTIHRKANKALLFGSNFSPSCTSCSRKLCICGQAEAISRNCLQACGCKASTIRPDS
eukprot:973992-Pelagomonas_calceolata.AAC.4